jgi:hypothetical protein
LAVREGVKSSRSSRSANAIKVPGRHTIGYTIWLLNCVSPRESRSRFSTRMSSTLSS